MTAPRWRALLSAAAANDFNEIVRWTTANFGEFQARAYKQTISIAVKALDDGPRLVGVRSRHDLAPGLYILHVAREGRRGRHVLVFQIDEIHRKITVLRMLHDSMDLSRHMPGDLKN